MYHRRLSCKASFKRSRPLTREAQDTEEPERRLSIISNRKNGQTIRTPDETDARLFTSRNDDKEVAIQMVQAREIAELTSSPFVKAIGFPSKDNGQGPGKAVEVEKKYVEEEEEDSDKEDIEVDGKSCLGFPNIDGNI